MNDTLIQYDWLPQYQEKIIKNYPNKLIDLWIYLNEKITEISFTNYSNDGRINSIFDENTILDILEKKFKIIRQSPRSWCDLIYEGYPINIKITNGTTADNAFNKKGLIYSCCSIDTIPNSLNFRQLKKHMDIIKSHRDFKEYYYLVFFKTTRIPIIKSLLDIQSIKPNPTNILQINWDKEYLIMDKFNFNLSILDIRNNIMKIIQLSLRKKMEDIQDIINEKYH